MGEDGQKNRLSAILAADIAGYTRLIEQDTDGTVAAGELGSVFGHLYLASSNLTECFGGGRIAGLEASGAA